MSLINNSKSVQNRLKLKARRVNKSENHHLRNNVFKGSSESTINTNRRECNKRFRPEDDKGSQNKRFCQWEASVGPSKNNVGPSKNSIGPLNSFGPSKNFNKNSSKNLANKRLKTLRESLKSCLKKTSNKEVKESFTNSTNGGNLDNSVNTSKNIAENRLNRLRRSICSPNKKNAAINTLKDVSIESSQLKINTQANDLHVNQIASCFSPSVPNSIENASQICQANVSSSNYTNSWVNERNEKSVNLTKASSETLVNKEDSVLVNVNESAANLLDLSKEGEEMDWSTGENETKSEFIQKRFESNHSKPKIKNLCIVVDTNILMSNLRIVQEILSKNFGCAHQPVVFIPWIVMTELDYMKDKTPNEKLKKLTTAAIRFINIELEMENPRLKGQTVVEASKQEIIGCSPDDKIIACCLQIMQIYEDIILLSNDVNLKSKAMINNISTCSANDALVKIVTKIRKNTKSQLVLNKMGILCSQVIIICARKEFGEIASKMELLKNGPWPIQDCLKRFQRYWATVFREKVNKQFTKSVEIFSNLLAKCQYIRDDSEDFTLLMKQCITMCIFLKDISECREFVQRTLDDLIKINEG